MAIPLPAHDAAPWLAPAIWLVARGTLLLAAAALLAAAMRRGPAAARHLVWGLAMASLLALPALTLVMPHWELAFVSVDAKRPALLPGGARADAIAALPWGWIALGLWSAGALIALSRLAVAHAAVRALARRSEAIVEGEWIARLGSAARELGITRPVRLLRAPADAMPMTWGVLRPTVLVPAEADAWSPERRRVVLLHELAHVARRDCLWQMVASLCCAVYWFHPGAWWAAHRMREEREQACDDRVLAAGTRASDYAGHLLAVARAFRPARLTSAAAVGMAARSQLEDRVVAVLDGARARGTVPARAALACAALGALALLPLAAASPTVRAEAPDPRISSGEAAAEAPAQVQPSRRAARRAMVARASAAPSAVLPTLVESQPLAAEHFAAPEPLDDHELAFALSPAARVFAPTEDVRVLAPLSPPEGATTLALSEHELRPEGADSRRAPTGTGRAIQPPRAGRAEPAARPADPALRILAGLNEQDTLPTVGGGPAEIPQSDM